jgi:phosphoribosylanthranilate isomerase
VTRLVVKICGITHLHDALECVLAGADVIGFHFDETSPRFIEPAAARRVVERLPAFVGRVGVFTDQDPSRVALVARQVGLTAVQLHGDEPAEECQSLAPLAWVKAFRVGPSFDPDVLAAYPCSTYLLDAWRPEWSAGTRMDWRRARPWGLHGRIVIAGGLDPDNVEAAIDAARPYGVDVSSGVESVPGRKDLDRVEAFVRAARRAEGRLDASS